MSHTDFIAYIPPEQKDLLELTYHIYGDGSCDTTKTGGYACIIIDNKKNKTVLKGRCTDTTNNRMELTALIEGLKFVSSKLTKENKQYAQIILNSDSTYCTNTLREWIHKWVAEDYKDRPNSDLLRLVYPYLIEMQPHLQICWQPRNSCEPLVSCDTLANQEREELKLSM